MSIKDGVDGLEAEVEMDSAFDADLIAEDGAMDSELQHLLEQVRDVPGPTPEQLNALDSALAPYLDGSAVVPDSIDSADTTGSGSTESAGLNPRGEGPGISGHGLGAGKVAAVLGGAAVAGALLWGMLDGGEPSTAEAPTALVSGDHQGATQPTLAEQAENASAKHATGGISPDKEQAAEVPHEDSPRAEGAEDESKRAVQPSPEVAMPAPAKKPVARGKAAAKKPTDWTQELERLKQAEAQINQGAPQRALEILRAEPFKALPSKAAALKARALCSGTPAQRRQGAALAKRLSQSPKTELLVRRLRSCIDGG